MTVTTAGPSAAPRRRSGASTWARLTLAQQFMLAGACVLAAGMLAIGFWVTQQIERGVTRNSAISTALYMDSVVSPLVQELAASDELSPAARAEVDEVLTSSPLGQRLVSYKIWKEGGRIAYASREEMIGRTFEPSEKLNAAWAGEVAAEFEPIGESENAAERATGVPLLEIYSPIREVRTGRIIAVAEFYEAATALERDLLWAKIESWAVVTFVTLLMMGTLFGIVLRGSRTIAAQRSALEERVAALSELLRQNEALRERVQRASSRASEINERYLRRISADLHDGPAQHLALASLRLDSLSRTVAEATGEDDAGRDVDVVRAALADALDDIRNICKGLTLPELGDLPLSTIVERVTSSHERRTGTNVSVVVDDACYRVQVAQPVKICLYRFVQEALSNATRHAGGVGQEVHCRVEDGMLEAVVSDCGGGIPPAGGEAGHGGGLGLVGLRERIESLGGQFSIDTAPGAGTRLTMRLAFSGRESADD